MERAKFNYHTEEANGAYNETQASELGRQAKLELSENDKDNANTMPTKEEVMTRSGAGTVNAGAQRVGKMQRTVQALYEQMDANERNIYPPSRS